MHRHKERGFCCGAGGARMWMEERIGKRINNERVDEALSLNPDIVSTACPFCLVMLTDSVNGKKNDGKAKENAPGRRRRAAAPGLGEDAGGPGRHGRDGERAGARAGEVTAPAPTHERPVCPRADPAASRGPQHSRPAREARHRRPRQSPRGCHRSAAKAPGSGRPGLGHRGTGTFDSWLDSGWDAAAGTPTAPRGNRDSKGGSRRRHSSGRAPSSSRSTGTGRGKDSSDLRGTDRGSRRATGARRK